MSHVVGCPVVHTVETPVAMLVPCNGKTHRADPWAYAAGASVPLRAVFYGFTEPRSGKHARSFLGNRRGSLVCDDNIGYKASFALVLIEAGTLVSGRSFSRWRQARFKGAGAGRLSARELGRKTTYVETIQRLVSVRDSAVQGVKRESSASSDG